MSATHEAINHLAAAPAEGTPAPALQWMTKAGKCANGAERDSGTIAHRIPSSSGKALCGETTRSWWSEVRLSDGGWPKWARKCPTCERMETEKTECPICHQWVMRTTTGLRTHKCKQSRSEARP